jgi:hypothetical protein
MKEMAGMKMSGAQAKRIGASGSIGKRRESTKKARRKIEEKISKRRK